MYAAATRSRSDNEQQLAVSVAAHCSLMIRTLIISRMMTFEGVLERKVPFNLIIDQKKLILQLLWQCERKNASVLGI